MVILDVTRYNFSSWGEVSESKPINNTWANRMLTIAAIKLFRRHRSRRCGGVLFLTRNLCVKYGSFRDLSEAATIQFIAQNTSIPVPKIHCSFKRGKDTYIVMQRIDGLMLGHQWARRSEDSKSRILHQLKTMVEEMRSIPRPNNIGVESVDGGTLWDCRLPSPLERFGPFKTIQEFHRYLRNGVETSPDNKLEVNELIALHNGIWPVPCFTHGDLSSLNVLARGDNVVGIIDWETAGWYPHYWEYATACNVNPRNLFWRNEIERFLESFP